MKITIFENFKYELMVFNIGKIYQEIAFARENVRTFLRNKNSACDIKYVLSQTVV